MEEVEALYEKKRISPRGPGRHTLTCGRACGPRQQADWARPDDDRVVADLEAD